MFSPNLPPIEPIAATASQEERFAAYERYCLMVVAENPTSFLPLGVHKRWYHGFIWLEHPLTRWNHCDEQTR